MLTTCCFLSHDRPCSSGLAIFCYLVSVSCVISVSCVSIFVFKSFMLSSQMVREQYKRSRSQEGKVLGSPAIVILDMCLHLKRAAALLPGSVDGCDHSRNCPVSKPRCPNVSCRRPNNNAADQNASRTSSQLCSRYVAPPAQLKHAVK